MNELIGLIDHWQRPHVIVVGDYMLDRYVYGNAERLSPDAPVPVLCVQQSDSRPGGAANVALCLEALDCVVSCVGLTGDDDAGRTLRRYLQHEGCDTAGLIIDALRPTTVKQSMVGLAQHRHPQKMFRLDYEDTQPITRAIADQITERVAALLDERAVLCLEDYDKGLLSPALCERLIGLARERGVSVLVDPPAIADYAKYRGAACITPNRTEAERATGVRAEGAQAIDRMTRQIMQATDCEAVVLTLDRHGAMLLERGGEPKQVPTVARSVYDVTGAGDVVLAALAAARGSGADWHTAVQMANLAAGLEVERFGIVPIALSEVLVAALQSAFATTKVRTLEQLMVEVDAWRKQGRSIAFTNGCFDILHTGHIHLLRGAKARADLLILAVNNDASIRRLKGADRPILPQADRGELLSELASVDYVVFFGGEADYAGGELDTPRPLLRALQPDVLVKGGQYARHEVVGHEIVDGYGGEVLTIAHVQGRSTSDIVERIRTTDG
ncbi:MAG: adenylyltransferase/cytidyltransferase family protein [Planctomycetes bacterium]|jgi:D-beta-D-heptose 7-phosphate kinase/D-beta-D-heptose 1-phosphate adenosyltransferase|nr:adenylyltransferase/cytidyltransferase family protein [Planctomycetota bacterium]